MDIKADKECSIVILMQGPQNWILLTFVLLTALCYPGLYIPNLSWK